MIKAALRQIGLVPGDLDRLVLTHFHDDHTGSAAEVSSWGTVQVIAHAADAPVIRGLEADLAALPLTHRPTSVRSQLRATGAV